MGSIVGAALVAHVPTIVLPDEVRIPLNGGVDITLIDGLRRIRSEKLDALQADTFLIIDTHWFTTFEFIVTSHAKRVGRYTSDELPRGMAAVPFDLPGDPLLAQGIESAATELGDTWAYACDHEYLPVHYPTINLTHTLQGDERWVSASVCQIADTEDFLSFGRAIRKAVEASDRRVVILASGGMSHRFWPLREIRKHETNDRSNVISAEACAADLEVLTALERGDHAWVINNMPAYRQYAPEGRFGHYLTMAGALGGTDWTSPGTRYSEYEAAVGTGQAHVWFDC